MSYSLNPRFVGRVFRLVLTWEFNHEVLIPDLWGESSDVQLPEIAVTVGLNPRFVGRVFRLSDEVIETLASVS